MVRIQMFFLRAQLHYVYIIRKRLSKILEFPFFEIVIILYTYIFIIFQKRHDSFMVISNIFARFTYYKYIPLYTYSVNFSSNLRFKI